MSRNNWRARRTLFYTPRPEPAVPPRKAGEAPWWIRLFFRGIGKICTFTGAVVLILFLFGFFSAMLAIQDNGPATQIPPKLILVMQTEGDLPEKPGGGSLGAQLGIGPATLRQTIDAIDAARDDNRVKAFVLHLRESGLQLTKIQELRTAIARFRESGKPTYVYSDDMAKGLGAYYLASAFEQIWMQPVGAVSIPGINLEMPFVRGTLDRIGVEPQVFKRKAYKSFFETATNSHVSDANREMMNSIISDMGEQIMSGTALSRGMKNEAFKALLDKGLFTDQEALAAHLVDHLDYGDMLLAEIRKNLGGTPDDPDLPLLEIKDYANAVLKQDAREELIPDQNPEVALIYLVGAIMPGKSKAQAPVFMGEDVATAEDIATAIEDATADDRIKSIVLRIDSPGGSPTASETIRRAIVKAQEKGKPVIVSMGATAASGGYWVACAAKKIYALPATFTGSIGVVSAKFVLAGLWDKIGVNWDTLKWGENAAMWSFNRPFSESESERMNAMMDSVYGSFLTRVAEGRHMSVAQVDAIAGGRVWTGQQARKNGLVDALGGLDAALDDAATFTGAKNRHDAKIVVLPRPKSLAEQIIDFLQNQARAGESLKVLSAVGEWVRPYMDQAAVAENSHGLMTYDPPPAVK